MIDAQGGLLAASKQKHTQISTDYARRLVIWSHTCTGEGTSQVMYGGLAGSLLYSMVTAAVLISDKPPISYRRPVSFVHLWFSSLGSKPAPLAQPVRGYAALHAMDAYCSLYTTAQPLIANVFATPWLSSRQQPSARRSLYATLCRQDSQDVSSRGAGLAQQVRGGRR
jgi:hypothetical protein